MEIRLRKLTSSMPGLNLVQIYDKSCVCCLINLHMINFNEIFICKFWNQLSQFHLVQRDVAQTEFRSYAGCLKLMARII